MRQWLTHIRRILTSWEFWVSVAVIFGSAIGVIVGQLRRNGVTWEQFRFVIGDNLPRLRLPTVTINVHVQQYDYTLLVLMLMLFINAWVVYVVIREMRD